MKERIVWVDYVKAFCIFFIVLLHAGIEDPFKNFFRVFVIPAFFFISGLFFNTQKYPNVVSFFKERILKILVSYLFFNILTYLFWLVIGRHFGADADLTEVNLLSPLLGILLGDYLLLDHYRPFWFLACLISVEIFAFFSLKNLSKKLSILILMLFFLIAFLDYYYKFIHLPWGLNIAFSMIIFFILGVFLSSYLLYSKPIKKEKNYTALIILFSFFIVYYCANNNSEIKVFIREYGNYALFIIGSLSGIIFMISSFKLFAIYFPNVRFLQFIGQNTLLILVFHLIAFSAIKAVTYFILKLPLSIYENQWVVVCISISSILLLYPVIIFFNKYLPFLIGKKTHEISEK